MQRRNNIPTKPRFDFVTKKAYALLLEYGYNKFPLSPFKVLEDLSDYVVCLSWSDAKKAIASEDPFHLHEIRAEARTIRHRDDGKYYIVYDDLAASVKSRTSWTIMHEIGHVILGHLTDFDETALDRGGLTNKKYGVLEVEAHYFASEFLMPTALVRHLSNITAEEIALLFGVSEEAAKKKYEKVFKSNYLPSTDYDEKLLRNFFDFLENDANRIIYNSIYSSKVLARKANYRLLCRKCPRCYTYIEEPDAKYCHYCGEEIGTMYPHTTSFGLTKVQKALVDIPGISRPYVPSIEMKLSNGIKANRVSFCPTCLNQEIATNAMYCGICGQPLYSICEADGQYLNVNECFCPRCGAESTFHRRYINVENRLSQIKKYAMQIACTTDWLEYPYWGYVRMYFYQNSVNPYKLIGTAIFYSRSYIDDNYKLIVFTDSVHSSAIIYDNKAILLKFVCQTDNVEYSGLEVYVSK